MEIGPKTVFTPLLMALDPTHYYFYVRQISIFVASLFHHFSTKQLMFFFSPEPRKRNKRDVVFASDKTT